MEKKEALEILKSIEILSFRDKKRKYFMRDVWEAKKVAIKALEQQPCEDKQDCEHCIHTYGTLGCCDMVNNEWIYDCDFGIEQYRKEHGKPCEDCISRETIINTLNYLCDCLCEYSKKQRAIMCDACKLGIVIDKVEELPSVTPKARWIPVSERLPEREGWYLTSLGDKTYGGADIDMYCKGWVKYGTHVLAWMPLPQPYTESEG